MYSTAPEGEHVSHRPQGRIRRDSIQVSTIYNQWKYNV